VTIVENAPAKINLGLKILGKRGDGFHDILSIFQTVDLIDELVLTDSRRPGLDCGSFDVPGGPDNLVLKAERCFRDAGEGIPPLHFTLRKSIPVGAGLGGGSSDAAATLRGLARFHGTEGATADFLRTCAANLGSDIPFLLDGGTAVVSGRGERIVPVLWPYDFTYVLVYPGFGVSTAWAYGQVRKYSGDGGEYGAVVRDLEAGTLNAETFFQALSNDFEAVVFPAYPVLEEIRSRLRDGGADAALLTGSGSTMLGVFRDGDAAETCAGSLRGGDFSVFMARRTSGCR
jgi:4-diphosphocytidyl-2-C-methyl-D-erythritol kinase